MSGEFLGTFQNSVNKQKWIIIPAVFKKKFSTASKQTVIITVGAENNIVIYPIDNWKELMSKLKQGSEKDLKFMHNLRTFASSEQKIESTGRIKLSDEHLEIAGISGKVILKGEGNFISVWNPEKYKEFRQKMLEEHRKTFTALDYQR
ncbi:MAG: protein MraZ [Candidatus Cloacimonadota bacterium]|nr:MAG: protein MraZ [Candidatus Cloacimonadota bacterium]